jgi:excisionase family DNA binding protein
MQIELHTPLDDTPLQVKITRAAAALDCSERTVTRLLERGELRGVGRGRLRRVEWASILEYIARHRDQQDGGRDNGR